METESARRLAKYLGADYLFGLTRDCLLSHDDNDNKAIQTHDLLTAASQLGHEEATWLLSL